MSFSSVGSIQYCVYYTNLLIMSGREVPSVWQLFAILFLVFVPCALCDYCEGYTDSSGVFNRGFYCLRYYQEYCCGSTSTGKYCCDWEEYQDWSKGQDDEGMSTLVVVLIGVIIFIGVISFCIIFVCVCVVTAPNSNSSTNGSSVHLRRTRVMPKPDNEILGPPPYPAMGPPPAYDDIYQHSENHNRPPAYTVSAQVPSITIRPVHQVDTSAIK
ncbi:uncharacterized protein LOC117115991 [Anneissia japonica]|uniref:uncharacterized protein LOC117115991 n=1 Tax=Anneissia japonica TaxID=1529436 RepID=UPI001425884C|nr:uncharacterized protein LOC117115991 [Anneissia japonica]